MSKNLLISDTRAGIACERGQVNINGPSLIRVPDWVTEPLGRYYLYFAHHAGHYIRMAFADDLLGPWTVFEPGTLHLEQTPCHEHIASPDVHVDSVRQEIRMYYHGPVTAEADACAAARERIPVVGMQRTLVANSMNGVSFRPVSNADVFGPSYCRLWRRDAWWYALGMRGFFYRSRDGLRQFEQGPKLFSDAMRHCAVKLEPDRLQVYFSDVGDCPERIKCTTISLTSDWMTWTMGSVSDVVVPTESFEGVNCPLTPSQRGLADGPVHQLRDPAIFQEGGRTWLLYTVAGERGIAITELGAN